ncbi:MAG: hypothetical protein A3F72_06850 [Bacteroidetes bacterium RIFCSPLOWO2_12_FULL_35_15]|nr:MAG: hypothetical protein A3F72_06850 [Bacteroidetes bacterium RIFCSPLOWO2_12_FULL_35_15]
MQNQSHSLGIIPVSFSKLLERLGYYGMRSILVLFLLKDLGFTNEKSALIYGYFTGLSVVIPIIGGLIADLLIGTKRTAIIGGFIQALGCFTLVIPSEFAVYLGLFFIALGTGFYNPNIISLLGSIYSKRLQKLDAAMLIFYSCIHVGALFGPLFIGVIADLFGYKTGFIISGTILILAQLLLLFLNNLLKEAPTSPNIYLEEEKRETTPGYRAIIIIAITLLIPVFWIIYQLDIEPLYERMDKISESFNYFRSIFSAIGPITIFFVGIILAIIFSFVKLSSFLKILIGFIIYATSSALLNFYYQLEISNSFLFFVFFALFLQGISEVFISPIALSIICKYGSTKFNSTLIGLFLAISTLVSYFGSFLTGKIGILGSNAVLVISLSTISILASVFFVLYFFIKKSKPNY